MKNTLRNICFLLFLSAAVFFLLLISSCSRQIQPERRLPDPIEEIYESEFGLVIVAKKGHGLNVEYYQVLIELSESEPVYFFALEDREYSLRFWREGNVRTGTAAVLVAIQDQVYSIDSPFLTGKK